MESEMVYYMEENQEFQKNCDITIDKNYNNKNIPKPINSPIKEKEIFNNENFKNNIKQNKDFILNTNIKSRFEENIDNTTTTHLVNNINIQLNVNEELITPIKISNETDTCIQRYSIYDELNNIDAASNNLNYNNTHQDEKIIINKNNNINTIKNLKNTEEFYTIKKNIFCENPQINKNQNQANVLVSSDNEDFYTCRKQGENRLAFVKPNKTSGLPANTDSHKHINNNKKFYLTTENSNNTHVVLLDDKPSPEAKINLKEIKIESINDQKHIINNPSGFISVEANRPLDKQKPKQQAYEETDQEKSEYDNDEYSAEESQEDGQRGSDSDSNDSDDNSQERGLDKEAIEKQIKINLDNPNNKSMFNVLFNSILVEFNKMNKKMNLLDTNMKSYYDQLESFTNESMLHRPIQQLSTNNNNNNNCNNLIPINEEIRNLLNASNMKLEYLTNLITNSLKNPKITENDTNKHNNNEFSMGDKDENANNININPRCIRKSDIDNMSKILTEEKNVLFKQEAHNQNNKSNKLNNIQHNYNKGFSSDKGDPANINDNPINSNCKNTNNIDCNNLPLKELSDELNSNFIINTISEASKLNSNANKNNNIAIYKRSKTYSNKNIMTYVNNNNNSNNEAIGINNNNNKEINYNYISPQELKMLNKKLETAIEGITEKLEEQKHFQVDFISKKIAEHIESQYDLIKTCNFCMKIKYKFEVKECFSCLTKYCKDCASCCLECETILCLNCIGCRICQEAVCVKCRKVCASCKNEFIKSSASQNNRGILLCNNCLLKCFNCNQLNCLECIRVCQKCNKNVCHENKYQSYYSGCFLQTATNSNNMSSFSTNGNINLNNHQNNQSHNQSAGKNNNYKNCLPQDQLQPIRSGNINNNLINNINSSNINNQLSVFNNNDNSKRRATPSALPPTIQNCSKTCKNCAKCLCLNCEGPNDFMRCPCCKEYFCYACKSVCIPCKQVICKLCIDKCKKCGKIICKSCSISCNNCREAFCSDICAKQNFKSKCKKCNKNFCNMCFKEYTSKCFVCKDPLCKNCILSCGKCENNLCNNPSCNPKCDNCGSAQCQSCLIFCVCEKFKFCETCSLDISPINPHDCNTLLNDRSHFIGLKGRSKTKLPKKNFEMKIFLEKYAGENISVGVTDNGNFDEDTMLFIDNIWVVKLNNGMKYSSDKSLEACIKTGGLKAFDFLYVIIQNDNALYFRVNNNPVQYAYNLDPKKEYYLYLENDDNNKDFKLTVVYIRKL